MRISNFKVFNFIVVQILEKYFILCCFALFSFYLGVSLCYLCEICGFCGIFIYFWGIITGVFLIFLGISSLYYFLLLFKYWCLLLYQKRSRLFFYCVDLTLLICLSPTLPKTCPMKFNNSILVSNYPIIQIKGLLSDVVAFDDHIKN